MNIKPKTFMIATLAVVLTAMSASTWAQSVDNQSDRQERRERSDRQQRRDRPDRQMARQAKIGEPAPNFRLKDASGKVHTLADYKGKLVILQWISPDCPVCKRVNSSGITSDMLKTIKGLDSDFVHLTINSNAGSDIAKSAEYLNKYNVKSPALDDTAGRVGRMYGAKTTPHMFVIDKKGILRYSGAIDDDQAGRNRQGATNYVINAVNKIVANETVTPDMTKSYGCAVKYAKAPERPSRGERGAGGRRGGRGGQMFSRLDTNGDGIIDAKEMESIPEARRQGILDRFDTNKDGTIDKEEIEAAGQRQRGSDGQRGGRGEGRRGGRGGDGGRGGRGGGSGGDGGRGGDGG